MKTNITCKNIYLHNCAYKNADKQMIDYLSDNPFETNEC